MLENHPLKATDKHKQSQDARTCGSQVVRAASVVGQRVGGRAARAGSPAPIQSVPGQAHDVEGAHDDGGGPEAGESPSIATMSTVSRQRTGLLRLFV